MKSIVNVFIKLLQQFPGDKFNWNIQLGITFKANSKSLVIQPLDKLSLNKPVTDLHVHESQTKAQGQKQIMEFKVQQQQRITQQYIDSRSKKNKGSLYSDLNA